MVCDAHAHKSNSERKKHKDRKMPDLKLGSSTLIPKRQNLIVINLTHIDRHAFICPVVLFSDIYLTGSPACGFNNTVTFHGNKTTLLLSAAYITKGTFILKSITWSQWHSHIVQNPLTLSFITESTIKADNKRRHAIKWHKLLNNTLSMSSVCLFVTST